MAVLNSFCCHDIFMMKMIFDVDLDNKKVVDNLLIYLVPHFYGYRLNGLRVTAV
jgi:hypothetical protein